MIYFVNPRHIFIREDQTVFVPIHIHIVFRNDRIRIAVYSLAGFIKNHFRFTVIDDLFYFLCIFTSVKFAKNKITRNIRPVYGRIDGSICDSNHLDHTHNIKNNIDKNEPKHKCNNR